MEGFLNIIQYHLQNNFCLHIWTLNYPFSYICTFDEFLVFSQLAMEWYYSKPRKSSSNECRVKLSPYKPLNMGHSRAAGPVVDTEDYMPHGGTFEPQPPKKKKKKKTIERGRIWHLGCWWFWDSWTFINNSQKSICKKLNAWLNSSSSIESMTLGWFCFGCAYIPALWLTVLSYDLLWLMVSVESESES